MIARVTRKPVRSLKLILSRKFFVDPEKLLAFIQHADETTEAGVFGFEQSVEFAQDGDVAQGVVVFVVSGLVTLIC